MAARTGISPKSVASATMNLRTLRTTLSAGTNALSFRRADLQRKKVTVGQMLSDAIKAKTLTLDQKTVLSK